MVDQYAGCRLWAKQAVNAGRVSTETGKVGGVLVLTHPLLQDQVLQN